MILFMGFVEPTLMLAKRNTSFVNFLNLNKEIFDFILLQNFYLFLVRVLGSTDHKVATNLSLNL